MLSQNGEGEYKYTLKTIGECEYFKRKLLENNLKNEIDFSIQNTSFYNSLQGKKFSADIILYNVEAAKIFIKEWNEA